MAGSAYSDASCAASGTGRDVADLAAAAREEMGERARVVPIIDLNGDADPTVPSSCGDRVVQQALRTANLVVSGRQDEPVALRPASVRPGRKPGGHGYDVRSYTDPTGCLLAEQWVIHGMSHFWSGGSEDPRWAEWTDPRGPSAAEASWAFFSRFRRSETSPPCAESSLAGAPPRPSPGTARPPAPAPGGRPCWSRRTLVIRLPRHLRSARVTYAGRRARILRGRRLRARLDLRRVRADVVRVRIDGRTRSGRADRRTRVLRLCRGGRR
jgi:hypothetical protein